MGAAAPRLAPLSSLTFVWVPSSVNAIFVQTTATVASTIFHALLVTLYHFGTLPTSVAQPCVAPFRVAVAAISSTTTLLLSLFSAMYV